MQSQFSAEVKGRLEKLMLELGGADGDIEQQVDAFISATNQLKEAFVQQAAWRRN